jgi:hypothetical protein
VQVAADFPLSDDVYAPKFRAFEVDGPGPDTISIQLRSPIPIPSALRLGQEVYRRPPWAIYRNAHSWLYLGIPPEDDDREPHVLAVCSEDHSRTTVYRPEGAYRAGPWHSLTTFPSDQILLARVLAERQGCYLHAAGMIVHGQGLLFVGHSEAGKSTTLKVLRGEGEILCDDRMVVRRWAEGFRIHGTWSHGELPEVSPASAPLRAIMYLEKAEANEIIALGDGRERLGRALSHLIKPLASAEWWEKTLDLAGQIAAEVPAYRLRLDQSGRVADLLRRL